MFRKRGIFILSIILLIILGLGIIGYSLVRSIYSDYYEETEIVKKVDDFKNTDIILPEVEGKELSEYYEEEAIFEKAQKVDGVYNFLLVGMDARNYEERSRSDSIILVSYDTNTQKISLMSFMRDTWVYLPDRGWGRINSATAFGGIGLLINTINENFDLDVQHYAQIKFEDFKKVIDILGGIDIELDEKEIKYINNKLHSDDNDWNNDITAEPGMIHLNGTQTLWHCRNRSVGNSDFSRTERQRDVLKILIDKGKSLDGGKLVSLIYEMKDYVNTNIPFDLLISLSKSVIMGSNLEITTYQVPFDGLFKFANKKGASVIEIDTYKTAVQIHENLGLSTDNIEVIRKNNISYTSKPQSKPNVEIPKEDNKNENMEILENSSNIENNLENSSNVENNLENSSNAGNSENSSNTENNLENSSNVGNSENSSNTENNLENSSNAENTENSSNTENSLENNSNIEKIFENVDDLENFEDSENTVENNSNSENITEKNE